MKISVEGDPLSLAVSENDNRISIPLVIETASYYDIGIIDAKRMANEILTTVKENAERLAKQYGLSRTDIENMCPASDACYRED